MILIVGHRSDPHVESVAKSLAGGGLNFSILDSFDLRSDGLKHILSNKVVLDIDGRETNLSSISSVWWRQKPRFVIPNDSATSLYDYYFVHREWNHVLDYLGLALKDVTNVNDRNRSLIANNKVIQLRYAQDSGLNIPETLISNSHDSVGDFLSRIGPKPCIFKTFTPYMTPSGNMTYTTLVDHDILESKGDKLKAAPGIFQEFINKSFELRVTIVGSDIFAAKIESKNSERSYVDWRQEIFDDIFTEYRLENDLSQKLLNLHKTFGLVYGAYDLVIDESGKPYFLEVNPFGQWMWLELKLGFPIGERIATELMYQ